MDNLDLEIRRNGLQLNSLIITQKMIDEMQHIPEAKELLEELKSRRDEMLDLFTN